MNKKLKPYVIGAVAGIAAIVFLGGGAYVAYKKVKPLTKKIITKLSDMRFSSLKKATQDLAIANFEGPEDFKKFTDSNVDVLVSKDHCSNGAYCARVVFKKGRSPSFKIEQYFEKDKRFSNWAPYGSFLFDIYNPQDEPQRLILQIKDKSGDRYKQEITIEPKVKETIEVEAAVLRHHVSIYNVAQINLFRWEPQSDATFYIDNLRLETEKIRQKKSIFDPEYVNSKDPVYAATDYFYFPKDKWQTEAGTYRFPIRVLSPGPLRLTGFPSQGGIPFPKGMLKSGMDLEIKDVEGRVTPFQHKVMARWEDDSIKWLLVTMPVMAAPGTGAVYFADFPVKQAREDQKPWVLDMPASVFVDTGAVKFSISKKSFRLFDKVMIGGKEVISQESDLIIKFRGTEYRSSLDKDYRLTVEEIGRFSVGLKAEGWFVSSSGKKFCKFIVRIKAYKDESFVRVFHTFIYTGYPENKLHYAYKGKRLPKNETIQEVALDLRIPGIVDNGVLTFAADGKVMQLKKIDQDTRLLQDKDDHFKVTQGKKDIGSGKQLEGWADLSSSNRGVCAVVRKLWQQYPKGFELDPKNNSLKLKLWPQEAGELDLKTTDKTLGPEDVARGSAFGLGKTHELIFYFHEGDYKQAKAREMAIALQEPPLIMADASWFTDTRAVGAVSDYAKGINYFQPYEDALERLFDWADRQKKTFKWYGMLDFGDTLSWYRMDAYDKSYDEWGWHPEGRWGWFNCEGVGIHMGALLQFLRTGKYKYFEFGEDLARHMMDVDTCHFNTIAYDKRLKSIWQDYSQPGSMHRHSGDHWGGRNEEASHTNLNGILFYYYITGNDRALDVAKEIGEFFLKHPVTYFKHPDIAPHRGMANILMGEVALYEATGDERLKKDADYWADLFFQGQNRNGSFNENYNPRDKRWDGDPHLGYMNEYTVPALIDYHKLTGNKAIGETIAKVVHYLAKTDEYKPIFAGLAYSYFLTADNKDLEIMEKRLESMVASQRQQDDPLWNGMIYQKLYFERVVEFLYFTPYAFDALMTSNDQNTIRNRPAQSAGEARSE